jgi:hypothetical protein
MYFPNAPQESDGTFKFPNLDIKVFNSSSVRTYGATCLKILLELCGSRLNHKCG